MKKVWFFLLWAMAALASCTASKFKRFTKQSESANHMDRLQLEELSNEGAMQKRSVEHISNYDALWWLKGDVRLTADSGVFADEAFIQYQGTGGYQSLCLDSQHYLREHRLSREEALELETSEKLREKERKSNWQWYFAAIAALLFGRIAVKRLSSKRK